MGQIEESEEDSESGGVDQIDPVAVCFDEAPCDSHPSAFGYFVY